MIPDNDVASAITLPELKHDLSGLVKTGSIHQIVHVLSDLAVKFIQQHNSQSLIKCYRVAERLWNEGSQTTKNAIENVFVYSVTTRTEGSQNGLQEALSLLPVNPTGRV